MKILQLVTRRQYRGAEVFAANLSEELIKLGHEIIFAGLYLNDSNDLFVDQAKNIDLSQKKTEGISPQLVLKLARLINKEKPHVVQCNGSDTLKYMVAASYFTTHIPIIYRNISTISEWLDHSYKRRIYKFLFNHVDYVTSVGKESIEDLRETFGFPEHRTAVIRRGIPFKTYDPQLAGNNLRKELGLKSSDKIAIHVGNFSPEKNHSFLLELFTKIKNTHPEIKLVCVGSGKTFEEIKTEIKEKGLEETVFLMGFRKDIPELLAGSECFVLSSLVEGVPGVILEAAVQKKPSISTNVGGVQEVIHHGETGFIIDDFNVEKFRTALIELMANEKLRSNMGEKSYCMALKEFNPTRNAKRFETLYHDLVKKKDIKPKREDQKLRVLQIIQRKQFRGAELFASQLSNHLIEQGHEVMVYSIYEGKARLPFKNGVKSLDRPKTNRHFDVTGWKAIAEVVKSYQPDVIQANASDTLKYTVLSKFIYRWKAPIVYRNASISSFYINNVFSKNWNRFLLKKVNRIISVSHSSKQDLNSFFPLTRGKSEVITIGVEEILKPNISPYPGEFRNILHIGSFTLEKNHKGLLRIFARILHDFPDSRLHLVGDGPLKNRVEELIKNMGLQKKVFLHGEIRDPSNFIFFADALVLPSLIEGLPAVILEAMYLETPVVAYNVGGIPEVLSQKTGFPIEYGKESEFSQAIQEILKMQPSEKIRHAKERIVQDYLNKDIVHHFLEAYHKTV